MNIFCSLLACSTSGEKTCSSSCKSTTIILALGFGEAMSAHELSVHPWSKAVQVNVQNGLDLARKPQLRADN